MLFILLLLLFLIIIIITPVIILYKQYQIKLMLSYDGSKKSFDDISSKIYIKDIYYRCWYATYYYMNMIKYNSLITRKNYKYINIYNTNKSKKNKTYYKLMGVIKNNISEV